MNATLSNERRGAAVAVPRLLAVPTPDLAAHERAYGAFPAPHDLVSLLRDAGLRGHGGAAFPAWRKLAAVTPGRRAVVVANGAEGEPASAKDRTLLQTAPHLVLDGLALVGSAVGAKRAVVYVPSGLVPLVSRAVRERQARDRVAVDVVEAPDTFVAGEETAVVSRLSGGPALPLDKFTRIVESGVNGRPTVLNNVETLAHVALIARHGAAWFRAAGTDEDPGTFLATVSGAVQNAGVSEHGYGVSVGELLESAGGAGAPLQAVLVGGYHGAWLPMPEAADVAITRDDLAPYGAAPGAGVVVALPTGACGLTATARLVDYLADQTARQCGPCQFGLPRLADTFRQLASVPRAAASPHLVDEVQRLAALVDGRGACRHPDGTVRLLRSALSTFRHDVVSHLSGTCLGGRR
jgi:NADH:ubiquinone oxidoreductase subunit F (NADH-binding)